MNYTGNKVSEAPDWELGSAWFYTLSMKSYEKLLV